MRTRSQSRNSNSQQQQVPPTFVEPVNLVEPIENQAPPVVTMADNRTMAQLLEAPTEGYEDAIVVHEFIREHLRLKHGYVTLHHFTIESSERPRNNPSEMKSREFQQRFDETFYEAWDRFNDLLRACPHHRFSEVHQLDTFYNALNSNDQDSLNSATGGSGSLPSNTITNPKEDLKGITTRSGVAYQGPTIPTTTSSPPKVVRRETEVTKDMVPPTNNVLKSHKRAIAWKLSDIKGINPEFCTHKILMEEDYKPAVQHQRRVNPKIHDVIKKEVEKLLDAGLIYNDSDVLGNCLSRVDKMLKRCEDTNLCLNWEKSHFMVKEGIVLGHKISKNGIEVDKAKVDVIAKLPHPTTVKGVRSFLGHAGFYRRFIKDFSKIS
ncbi:hypothetical protein Tco_0010911 [Tanacetum coccineum]